MVRRPSTEPHDGPCTFDPVFGVEKVRKADGGHGLAIFCKCGKWEYVTLSPPPTSEKEEKIRFWPSDSNRPVFYAAGIFFMVIVLINNDAVRNLAVYPIHLLLLGASFMCARSVYRFLDPEWDKRKKQVGDKSYVNWRAFIAAVLIFLAVGTFLEALPTHQMARSFSHESFND